MEVNPKSEECKRQKMDVPVLVQVIKGENLIYEIIGNEADEDNLKALRESSGKAQISLNSYLTKLVDEERKIQPTKKSKDESSDSDHVSDEDADADVDNLLKTISSNKC